MVGWGTSWSEGHGAGRDVEMGGRYETGGRGVQGGRDEEGGWGVGGGGDGGFGARDCGREGDPSARKAIADLLDQEVESWHWVHSLCVATS